MIGRVLRETFISSDGIRLIGERGGAASAPAIIFMHGGGQTRHSWGGAVESLLEEGYQVINFDARGHGESDWSPTGAYTLSDRARDLATVTTDLQVPFILVGASLGGATSIVAIDEGMRPVGLVLVDIVPQPNADGIDRIITFMRGHPDGFASVDDAAKAVASYNPERSRPLSSTGLMKNLRESSDGRLRWHWDPRILDAQPETHHAYVQKAARKLELLTDLPVLLVRGLASDVVSDTGVSAFRDQLPRLEVLDVQGAGHMVAGDQNDAFNFGVIAFVKRVLGSKFRN